MAVYFADIEITGVKDLFPLSSKDITGLYFADTELFTVWGEYDGNLPAQYSANGSMLADYRVYGSVGGVGDETEQLFDMSTTIVGEGLGINGQIVQSSISNRSDFIKIFPNTTYVRKYNMDDGIPRIVHFYDVNKSYIGETSSTTRPNPIATFTTPTDAEYVLIAFPKNATQVSLMEGSPAEYVPYGYEVDMSVSDGTASTITPIYIGDTPLGEDEYVDFSEQKVYRRTENYFDGYFEQGTTGGGAPQEADNRVRSNIVAAVAGNFCVDLKNGENFDVAFDFWNGNVLVEATAWLSAKNYTTPNNAISVRIKIRKNNNAPVTPAEVIDFGMYPGSTAPSTYIPYLQPEDPPVLFPALPTVDGVNVVDYAGQSAAVPSRFVAKYRKEGFK